MRRRFVLLAVGDFNVIAEHFVERDFQIRDAGRRGLLGLIAGDPFLAARRQVAQPIQLAAIPAADNAAVFARQRAIVHERRFQLRANLRAEIEAGFELRKQR